MRLASPVVVINTAHRRMPYGYDPHPDTPATLRSLQCRHGFHRTGRTLQTVRRNPDRTRRSHAENGTLRQA